jgi:hypothetical protein
MSNKPPAFQFYPRDFLSSTAMFSTAEVGAYIRLLSWSWDNGPLPPNDERITRIAGTDVDTWRAIAHKWEETARGWVNPRLELERRKQAKFRKIQAGRIRKRWDSGGPTEPIPALGNTGPIPESYRTDTGPIPDSGPLRNTGPIPDLVKPDAYSSSSSSSADQDLETARTGRAQIARARVEPVWRTPGSQPQSIAAHQRHAFCATREGLCVGVGLHREFLGKLGVTRTEAELLAWYPVALAAFDGQAIGEDAFRFWRNVFAGWVGTATSAPAPGGKARDTINAVQRMVLHRQAEREQADRARRGGDP